MSDGITDVGRERHRGETYWEFLKTLIHYLSDPNKKRNHSRLIRAARFVDSIRGGYFSKEPTTLESGLGKMLVRLRKKDKVEWGKLLTEVMGTSMFNEARALSPFSDSALVLVQYSVSGCNIEGALIPFLNSIIKNEKKLQVYSGDSYLVAIPRVDLEVLGKKAQVHLLGRMK